MPTPEHRFEVPPEYAEVYERAYRRAYEQGQGRLGEPGGTESEVPPRLTRRRRLADAVSRGYHKVVVPPSDIGRRASREAEARAAAGGRPRPEQRRSARWWLAAVCGVLVVAALVVGAFVLGRLSAG